MVEIVIVVLVLILLAILLSYVPRLSETHKVIIFVVAIALVLLYLLRGSIL
jgi:hypothetical protein